MHTTSVGSRKGRGTTFRGTTFREGDGAAAAAGTDGATASCEDCAAAGTDGAAASCEGDDGADTSADELFLLD